MADEKVTKSAEEPELQAAFDEATEKGYFGFVPDPTPNEHYSLESSNWDTPESDPKMADKAGSSRFKGAK